MHKFVEVRSIEKQFKDLCDEYDKSVIFLHFVTAFNFRFPVEKENEVLRKDIEEFYKFQEALAESINEKITNTNNKMNSIVEAISELSIAMDNLTSGTRDVNQAKIDNIFQETLLSFDYYREDYDIRNEKSLKKYVHIKTLDQVAFKPVSKENINEVKNQVTILKQLRVCQNIIHFYGLTFNGGEYFLITEWADR